MPGYEIDGELDATFQEDGDAVIGLIPVLRIVAQGNGRLHAHALLQRLFSEYCEMAAEGKRLYEVLIKLGFRVIPPEAGGGGASQFLNITETPPEPTPDDRSRDDRPRKGWEVEFAGASR